ncbi:glycoside hydrolase family 3 N-terminal domain-containing protein [uncultured Shewanella sp.]|uniref:glycoside hydrolase family 3 N-terminal domain-containing protein n=1 Tax=uncultured Shewanella sp. TaxID=173975 RepID=UPI0026178F74|nr:glycoside hydrolase family 3 N-terminal domain-containing protein [uncultured Shewanella sp.]
MRATLFGLTAISLVCTSAFSDQTDDITLSQQNEKNNLATTVINVPKNSANIFDDYRAKTASIVNSMTLKQKIGQMTLPKYNFIKTEDENGTYYLNYNLFKQYYIGAVLAAGGEIPDGTSVSAGMYDPDAYLTATAENWKPLIEGTNNNSPVITLKNGQKVTIPLLTGIDAVHGFHEVLGNVIFPQNIGLSMTHDPKLLNKIGQVVANDMLQIGFNWTYSPTVAISHNPNWGRTFETLGSVPENALKDTRAWLKDFNKLIKMVRLQAQAY